MTSRKNPSTSRTSQGSLSPSAHRQAVSPSQPIDVAFPDLSRWSQGNAGVPFAWRFDSGRPGPDVIVQALTHGNEVCGAIALDWLLDSGFRPVRGAVTVIFANVAAYLTFDRTDPYASRCLDDDYNRLWSAAVLDGPRQSVEIKRARELRPLIDRCQYLLDLHSMTDPCPPLALCGRQAKGLALARAIGIPAHIVIDAGHAAGTRLRDYAFFDMSDDARNALLIECGQHWERTAPEVAKQAVLRFLQHFELAEPRFLRAWLCAETPSSQTAIEVTDAITIGSDAFAFVMPVQGLGVVRKRGTLLARDGSNEIVTPYDDCVLIMPTRRPKRGETAVRLGRFVT
ncbi:MAG TPA: succinylglutamate desuccinylase/aspartoacylase family protein [Casimicrobiaceae bacterium]|nr:succinylglutamate desuccinylase/aspartoacylase family protein [Casimicrobiaceae bacterium]